ncbi:MarR family winged helix-turn-helix transcriptional regulator [Motilibacter aurantiacus]|uniref:MarR family winged helix-turn-helix transcriptional regulator n=1 Tax=Motilibacter aurantiacus TaxID=2714955 RepID=UPI00140E530E|nr:MarR family transcriptional regulator [Motilibacter aurantiacus]NHC47325.1 MarR family transcriptional regulator [Motilibacter aurantiacus]
MTSSAATLGRDPDDAAPPAGGPGSPQQAAVLDELLCFGLYAASRAVTAVYRPLLEPLGLTYPQYLVMVLLWQRGSATVREVLEGLQLDYGTVSPLLKRLEARGLLRRERRADDERGVSVVLTEEGQALRARAAAVPSAIRRAMGLREDEVPAVHEVLRRIARTAGGAVER